MTSQTQTLNEIQLNSFIAMPPEGGVVVRITPTLAQYALDSTNKKNRPISQGKVVSYSRDMQSNNWSLTGETIKFGDDGLLKDGQHRLEACVRANTSFETHAVFGIDAETFQHIDIGKMRGGADTLAMLNVPNCRNAAAVIKQVIAYESGLTQTKNYHISNDWLKRKYMDEIDHDLLQESISVAKKVYDVTKWPTGVTGAFFYVGSQKGQHKQLVSFFEDFCKGIGHRARAPIPYLLEHINKLRTDRTQVLRAHDYGVMLSRTYRNYKAGKSSTKADVLVHLDDKMVAF